MNKKGVSLFFVILIFCTSAKSTHAKEIALEEVWKSILASSKAHYAAKLSSAAAGESLAGSKLHWLPRVYVDAKGYRTNDPGSSFFGVLSQRAVTSQDFSPSSLNHPESAFYIRGAIGMDLPLYEGGMKSAQVNMEQHLFLARENEADGIKVSQYAEVAKAYGELWSLQQQQIALVELQSAVAQLLRSYRLGNRSNPMGYSGSLGMKTLANRIEGLLQQNKARIDAVRNSFIEMGFTQKEWSPSAMNVEDFIKRFLPQDNAEASKISSAKTEEAKAMVYAAKMQNARYLPRLGLFAEEYLFRGKRDTESGYSAGVYLQWNLFQPSDYGAKESAKARAASAEAYSEAHSQQECISTNALSKGIGAAIENIRLMRDSLAMLREQTKVASGLFRNGSMNALQFVETLSRRVDLLTSYTEVELQLLALSADRANKTNFEIPFALEGSSK